MSDPDKRFEELEARILEQDHRSWAVVRNFFNRKQWPKEDARRKATCIALVWNLFFSPTVIATGGGIIAVGSLYFLYKQYRIMTGQLDTQREHDRLSRRTLAVSALYSVPPANHRVRKEAVLEFVHLERSAGRPVDLTAAQLGGISVSGENLSSAVFDSAVMTSNTFNRCVLTNCSFEASEMSRTIFRDCSLTKSRLAHAIATNSFFLDCDFRGAELNKVNFDGADLRGSTLIGVLFNDSTFRHANFGRARLQNSTFKGGNFFAAHFTQANVEGSELGGSWKNCTFKFARLSKVHFRSGDITNIDFDSCDLSGARFTQNRGLETAGFGWSNIHGAQSDNPNFRNIALQKGAVDEPDIQKWRAAVTKRWGDRGGDNPFID